MQKNASYGSPIGIFSGSTMKIIACIIMLIDHAGLILFPSYGIFRIIGRIGFPLFAYFIAEGSHYTKRKLKRFIIILSMGIAYLLIYYFFMDQLYASVFLSFSFSLVFTELLDRIKKALFGDKKYLTASVYSAVFVASMVGTWFVFEAVDFDYGFFGMLIPVLVNLFDFKGIDAPKPLLALDSFYGRFICYSIGVALVVFQHAPRYLDVFGKSLPMEYFAFLSIPALLLYNGKVGNKKLKYFFYIFYPVHLVVLEAIALVLYIFA